MKNETITFDKLPEAVGYLTEQVIELKKMVSELQPPPSDKRTLIEIGDACRIIRKAKATVYRLVQKGILPAYKKGKKLPYFIIMNVEGIRHKSGRSYPIADAIIDLINKREISMIAIDEVHKNTSPSSMQGKQLLRIKKATGRKCMWIPLTGTPITSKPTDVFLPLKLVDGHNFSSFYTWCQKFCVYGGFGGHEIVAYKNIPYLKELLEKNMIRRLKSEVLDL